MPTHDVINREDPRATFDLAAPPVFVSAVDDLATRSEHMMDEGGHETLIRSFPPGMNAFYPKVSKPYPSHPTTQKKETQKNQP